MCIDLVAQMYVADVEEYAKRHQNLADRQALETRGPRRQFIAFMPKPKDQEALITRLHGSEQDKRRAQHRCSRSLGKSGECLQWSWARGFPVEDRRRRVIGELLEDSFFGDEARHEGPSQLRVPPGPDSRLVRLLRGRNGRVADGVPQLQVRR